MFCSVRSMAAFVFFCTFLPGTVIGANRWALVIGVDRCESLGALNVCGRDARALQAALSEGGYTVSLLVDDDPSKTGQQPTYMTVRKEVEKLADVAQLDDTILFFFSGHGFTHNGQGFLAPSDGDRENGIPLLWIRQRMGTSFARLKFMIVDASRPTNAKGITALAPDLKAGSNVSVFCSCANGQVSWSDPESGHSVFVRCILEGFAGKAIGEGGAVTQKALFQYVTNEIQNWTTTEHKSKQSPILDASTSEGGDILLTHPVVVPSALPVDLSPAAVLVPPSAPVTTLGLNWSPPSQPVVPTGFRAAPSTVAEPHTKSGWAQLIVHEFTGIEMVYIPAGDFSMGSPKYETDRRDDEPQHRVTITRGFYMGKYEVTQGQWFKVMGRNPSSQKKAGNAAPVENVSWNEVQEFCARIGAGLRPPTEAEWEYACRAGTNTVFHFGTDLDSSVANLDGNYPYGRGERGVDRQTTVPVGQFKPNAWGLYDMHGNVWEWCQDWYGPYPTTPVTDPVGPDVGSLRIRRGGAFFDYARSCRSAFRGRVPADFRFRDLGFRVAKSVP